MTRSWTSHSPTFTSVFWRVFLNLLYLTLYLCHYLWRHWTLFILWDTLRQVSCPFFNLTSLILQFLILISVSVSLMTQSSLCCWHLCLLCLLWHFSVKILLLFTATLAHMTSVSSFPLSDGLTKWCFYFFWTQLNAHLCTHIYTCQQKKEERAVLISVYILGAMSAPVCFF